ERRPALAHDRELQSGVPRLSAELPHLHAGGGAGHSPLSRGRFQDRAGDDRAIRQLTGSSPRKRGPPGPRTVALDSPLRGNERGGEPYQAIAVAEALTVPQVAPRGAGRACYRALSRSGPPSRHGDDSATDRGSGRSSGP